MKHKVEEVEEKICMYTFLTSAVATDGVNLPGVPVLAKFRVEKLL